MLQKCINIGKLTAEFIHTRLIKNLYNNIKRVQAAR